MQEVSLAKQISSSHGLSVFDVHRSIGWCTLVPPLSPYGQLDEGSGRTPSREAELRFDVNDCNLKNYSTSTLCSQFYYVSYPTLGPLHVVTRGNTQQYHVPLVVFQFPILFHNLILHLFTFRQMWLRHPIVPWPTSRFPRRHTCAIKLTCQWNLIQISHHKHTQTNMHCSRL